MCGFWGCRWQATRGWQDCSSSVSIGAWRLLLRWTQSQQDHSMPCHRSLEFIPIAAQVLLTPEVAHDLQALEAKVGPFSSDGALTLAPVEETDGFGAVGQIPDPDFAFIGDSDAVNGFAERVLVNVNHLVVAQEAQREVV